MPKISNRPHLIRAFYDWILDCNHTPLLVLDTKNSGLNVPEQLTDTDEIVFNVSPQAIRDLRLGNKLIEFKASFSGIVQHITAPIQAVLALYAEEDGEGIFFDPEDEIEQPIKLRAIETNNIPMLETNLTKKSAKPVLTLIE